MPRKRIGEDVLTNAEKQRRYREKRRGELEKLKAAQGSMTDGGTTAPDRAAIREELKEELKAAWEPEIKAQRIAAERKKGRELAKQRDRNRRNGFIAGVCEAAAFFIGKGREDIAQTLIFQFSITRESAEAALQEDKRTRSITLETLDRAMAWKPPPPVIK